MPSFPKEAIVCFESASMAIMAEQTLTEKKFSVRVMPAPSGIREGCGFCLRFPPQDIERAIAFLFEQGFTGTEAYMREETEGLVSYRKIPSTTTITTLIAGGEDEDAT